MLAHFHISLSVCVRKSPTMLTDRGEVAPLTVLCFRLASFVGVRRVQPCPMRNSETIWCSATVCL